MDRLDQMRLFARVAERRSFSLAAQDLGVPPSTATDAVKQLEARLGVKLLERTTRHVAMTPDGEGYYRRCLAILDDVEDAESAFGSAKPKGVLRIDVQGRLARRFLLPSLPRFFAEYPGIELHMTEGDRFVDLVREGVDCVPRVGELADSEMIARRIALLPEVTCAAPSYVERFGLPESWDRLEGHRMIGFHSSATGYVLPLEFLVDGVVKTVTLPSVLSVNAAESYTAAAKLGLGIIQVPRWGAEEAFADGSLMPLLEDTPPSPSPVSLLYPKSRQLSPRVRVFIDWVMAEFKSSLRTP
jgi:DNA-binding transcriptional LysR family regulator